MTDNYYNSKDFRNILNSFEESEKNGENRFFDPDDLLDIVDYYCIYGNVPKAKKLINHIMEMFPDNDDAIMIKARMSLTYEHDPDEAEWIADKMSDVQDIDYLYLKAEIMLTRGQQSEAEQY